MGGLIVLNVLTWGLYFHTRFDYTVFDKRTKILISYCHIVSGYESPGCDGRWRYERNC